MKKPLLMSVSFAFSAFLILLPITDYYPWLRPQWALLVLLYWIFYSGWGFSHRLSIGTSWCLGLGIDLLSGALLGQYALLMALLNYLCSFWGNRLKLYGTLGQVSVIFILLILSQLPLYILYQLLAEPRSFYWYGASVLSSLLLWPVVYSLLRHYERKIIR